MSLEKKIKAQDFTKDATAVQGDVRTGKTFYNSLGKQTGNWSPKVTDFTGDATASEGDVRTGKTFYNSEGKKTGIWTPTPQEIIKDATAVPSDVANGKIFYNNNGRQVGTGSVMTPIYLHKDEVMNIIGEIPSDDSYAQLRFDRRNFTSYKNISGGYTINYALVVPVSKKPKRIDFYSPDSIYSPPSNSIGINLTSGDTSQTISLYEYYNEYCAFQVCNGSECSNDNIYVIYSNGNLYIGVSKFGTQKTITPRWDMTILYEL